MLDESELRALISRDVIDKDGKSVGYVETIFNDRDTGKPEWIGVFTGTLRHHHRLVPVQGADRAGTALQVQWTKEQVDGAPDYGTEETISEEMERDAYRHYGLVSATA
jgi:sporulation protein YlmC with PRC-barrel domain